MILTDEDKKLLTEKYPLYSQDNKRGDAVVVFKLFLPGTAATWYILEGNPEGEDFILFGYVTGLCEDEYGYISLNELEGLNLSVPMVDTEGHEVGRVPCRVEKDLYFKEGQTIGELFPALWK